MRACARDCPAGPEPVPAPTDPTAAPAANGYHPSIVDPSHLATRYGLRASGRIIIRPDGYLGDLADLADLGDLAATPAPCFSLLATCFSLLTTRFSLLTT